MVSRTKEVNLVVDKFQEYSHYSAEDFVEESSFWNWVLEEAGADHDFWKGFVEAYPAKAEVIKQAREKVLQLNTQEHRLPGDRVANLWAKINLSMASELPSEASPAKAGTNL
ncbi:hypothetical protein [Rufibacter latericius]|uniref:Uncharacterized protein n=1 Tax=Rufibacter latericius TaxID=2487040 RepID=A0A3M9N307_9BACT|nr:hypothetical protein [Rufibacter latericius]RNI31408.1 hypothetical protein EFB08_02475 [Rufibacter latericius]